jgi:hypothetical protein
MTFEYAMDSTSLDFTAAQRTQVNNIVLRGKDYPIAVAKADQ